MKTARHSIRLIRTLWRYRGEIDKLHGDVSTEAAVTIRSAINLTIVGRFLLRVYRLVIAVLFFGLILWALISIAVLVPLRDNGLWMLVAVLPAIAAGACGWYWLTLGVALRWLNEHDDPTQTIAAREIPGRLKALAEQTRSTANLPSRLSHHFEEIGDDVAADQAMNSH